MFIYLLGLLFTVSTYAADTQPSKVAEFMPTILREICLQHKNDPAAIFLLDFVSDSAPNTIKPSFSSKLCTSLTSLIQLHTGNLIKTQKLYENLSPHTVDRLAQEICDVTLLNKKATVHPYNMAEEMHNWLKPATEFPSDLAELYTTNLSASWYMRNESETAQLYMCKALGKLVYALRHKDKEYLFFAQPMDYENKINTCIKFMVLTAQSKIPSIPDSTQVDAHVAQWTTQLMKTFGGSEKRASSSSSENYLAADISFPAFA